MATPRKKTVPNKQRNEHLIELGDKSFVCKLTLSNIVEIEDYFDKTIFELVQLLDQGKFRVNQIIKVLEICCVNETPIEEIESAVLDAGTLVALTAITPLLLSAFAGNQNTSSTEKKS